MKVNKEVKHLLKCFTSYQPKEESDVIRYLFYARLLANCYDTIVNSQSEEEEEQGTNFIKAILTESPFNIDFHID